MSTPDLVVAAVLFVGLAVVTYAYLGYPVFVWLAARLFGRDQRRPEVDDRDLPAISLLIAAYNEEAEIAARIENALQLDYPADKLEIVVASDGSTDRTNEIVRRYEKFGVKLLAFEPRRGKANVLNDAIPAVSGEIVLLSDANTSMHATAAHRLPPSFQDPALRVHCRPPLPTDPPPP